MRQFAMPMWSHCSAAVQVRVDQRAERFGGFQPGVQLEAQLAGQRQVRSLARSADDFVDALDLHGLLLRVQAEHGQLASLAPNLGDAQAAEELQCTALPQAPQRCAEFAARRQGIRRTAAIDPLQGRRADGPGQPGSWHLLGHIGQGEQAIGR